MRNGGLLVREVEGDVVYRVLTLKAARGDAAKRYVVQLGILYLRHKHTMEIDWEEIAKIVRREAVHWEGEAKAAAARLAAGQKNHEQLLGKLREVSAVQRDAALRDLRAELEPVVRAEVEERCRADLRWQLEGELRALLSPLAERLGFVKDDADSSS